MYPMWTLDFSRRQWTIRRTDRTSERPTEQTNVRSVPSLAGPTLGGLRPHPSPCLRLVDCSCPYPRPMRGLQQARSLLGWGGVCTVGQQTKPAIASLLADEFHVTPGLECNDIQTQYSKNEVAEWINTLCCCSPLRPGESLERDTRAADFRAALSPQNLQSPQWYNQVGSERSAARNQNRLTYAQPQRSQASLIATALWFPGASLCPSWKGK